MDDLFKEFVGLIAEMEEVTPEWISEQEKRIDYIVSILPDDDVSAALIIISVAIDKYAAKQHLKSSELWKTMTDVAAAVHKEFGDYGEI